MKKIGIVTLNGNFNYGNRLQNYALQKILEDLGLSAETLIFDKILVEKDREAEIKKSIKYYFAFLINNNLYELFLLFYLKLNKKKYIKLDAIRLKNFKNFSSKFINEVRVEDIKKLNEKYDFFIVGSDQVWNPYYIKNFSIYFLDFAKDEKKIAYSPSFGISKLPKEYHKEFKDYLVKFSSLSVRESKGVEIIKELIGLNTQVTLDPTLLLPKEKWLELINVKSIVSENYLLTYFIGDLLKDDLKTISKIATSNKLKIKKLVDYRHKKMYVADPSEFLTYILNSSLVCTDSFHAVVFSIVFEKPFIVFKRVDKLDMYSRIETLLKTMNLESRQSFNIKINEDLFAIDYFSTNKILINEKEKSIDYLKKALKVYNQ